MALGLQKKMLRLNLATKRDSIRKMIKPIYTRLLIIVEYEFKYRSCLKIASWLFSNNFIINSGKEKGNDRRKRNSPDIGE